MRGDAVLCCAVEYCTVRCGVVRFCGPWCWVKLLKYSSFGWLFLLISDNLSDHVYVFLFVELIFFFFSPRFYANKFCSYMNMSSWFSIFFVKTPYCMSS